MNQESDPSRGLFGTTGGPAGHCPPDDVVNIARLQEAAGGSAAVVRELVEVYLGQAHQIANRLGLAIRTMAAGEVESLAHTLAGSSAACGITGLVSPSRQLEQLSRSPEFAKPAAEELVRTVQEQLAHAERLLASYCQTLPE